MNEDIQTADPRLRRITLVALALAGVAALAVVVAFHHWMTRQAAVLPAEQLVARLRLWIGIAMTASGLCLLLLAGCAARLARTTLDQRRWPPSSLRVLRDTPVRREAAAAAVARGLNITAVLLGALALTAAIAGWRLFTAVS